MAKETYNYFDDDNISNENIAGNNTSHVQNGNKSKLRRTTEELSFFIKNNLYTPRELNKYPYFKKAVIKWAIIALIILTVIICSIIFGWVITSRSKANDLFCKDAGKVCTNYIAEYGTCAWDSLDSKYGDNLARMTGLSYARRMDFNNDGKDELMACYYDSGVYYLEIWGYDGKDFIMLYSHEATYDTNNITAGSWIGFYRNNGKYYICQTEKDNAKDVALYALSGKEFKEKKSCTFNVDTGIYSINGKADTVHFERIALSFIRRSRADIITEIVTKNISEFETETAAQIDEQKSPQILKKEAYYEIIEKYNAKYGRAKYVNDGGNIYIDGLAVVQLIDFNNDGSEELLIVYRKNIKQRKQNTYDNSYISISVPVYCTEIYSWNGVKANNIFNKEGASTPFLEYSEYQKNNTAFIILQNKGNKTNICSNSYLFENRSSYTATSRIYTMGKSGKFSTYYTSKLEYDYGYKNYYINDERTYRTTFEQKGYDVPYFCNDDDYNKDEFTVTYLSGTSKQSNAINNTVSETTNTIKKLSPKYTADTN